MDDLPTGRKSSWHDFLKFRSDLISNHPLLDHAISLLFLPIISAPFKKSPPFSQLAASGNPIDNQGLGGSHLSRGLGGPGGGRYGDDSFGESRAARPEVPFPTQPPYTAFVGNLTFETVEADLRDFFHGLEVSWPG